jgi:hypothetical protein
LETPNGAPDFGGPGATHPTHPPFGFRKSVSTEDAAFKLIDNVLKSINQKMHVGGIFCDLAIAYDCVNHEILLIKYIFMAFKE